VGEAAGAARRRQSAGECGMRAQRVDGGAAESRRPALVGEAGVGHGVAGESPKRVQLARKDRADDGRRAALLSLAAVSAVTAWRFWVRGAAASGRGGDIDQCDWRSPDLGALGCKQRPPAEGPGGGVLVWGGRLVTPGSLACGPVSTACACTTLLVEQR
jgi:hypothetical protein